MPRKTPPVRNKSGNEYLRNAEKIPSGTPTRMPMDSAEAMSMSVAGTRCRMIGQTGSKVLSRNPRLPCTAWPSQFRYRMGRGWSKPNLVRSAAITSGSRPSSGLM